MTIRILLAGEGRSELGSRAGHPAYQSSDSPGVLEVLLQRLRADGWEVAGAREWRSVRQLQAGIGARDKKRVLALANDAIEANCSVLVFTRDRDNDLDRVRAIADGVAAARAMSDAPTIVGQVAVPLLEAWILALRGKAGTENLSPAAAKQHLIDARVGSVAAMVEETRTANLEGVHSDARGLRAWLEEARVALGVSSKPASE